MSLQMQLAVVSCALENCELFDKAGERVVLADEVSKVNNSVTELSCLETDLNDACQMLQTFIFDYEDKLRPDEIKRLERVLKVADTVYERL